MTRTSLELVIAGEPAPQGSKRHVGNGVMVEASKKVAPWRKAVAAAAKVALADDPTPFTEPVVVWTTYYLPRPKSVKRALPSVPPDLDKLERGLFDALTQAGVWTDDALVVDSHPRKRYADNGEVIGARVLIRTVSPENALL